jgi:hypothetical protein
MEFILFLAGGAALIFLVLYLAGKKPRDVIQEIKDDLSE